MSAPAASTPDPAVIRAAAQWLVRLHSVIVHETDTGYAQCFREDVTNPRMGLIELESIAFSTGIRQEWSDPLLFEKLKRCERLTNPPRV